ncbi:MAG: hypothetical protein JO358_12375, partial [Alphaproteobacteria bacterium]|nr:hypothetical protein [Alphaproteobacteria bacterium]
MVEIEFESIWSQHQAEQQARAQIADAATAAAPSEGTGAAAADVPTSDQAASPEGETDQPSAPPPTGAAVAETAGPAAPVSSEAGGETVGTSTAQEQPDQVGATETGATETEEELKAAFWKIAERRVRLGLLLAEVGRNNNIMVTQEEVNQAIAREARRRPSYEPQVLDFYRQNTDAVDS